MSFNGMDTYLKPRLCHLLKWPDFSGYGFNLHAEKGKAGQYIGKVDDDSPSQAAGMKEGDRIVEVNGVNIGNENHQQVVSRIKAGGEETRLLVVDSETDQHYKDEKKVVRGDLPEVVVLTCPSHDTEPAPAAEEIPPSYNDVAETATTVTHVETVQSSVISNSTSSGQFYPRLCYIKKRADFNGYGFNLHAERDKPGQFIGKIDDDSPSMAADLREGDRIVEVNGTNIESESHQRVIELIKSGGEETKLLVLDKATDEYYKSQNTQVTSSLPEVKHLYSEKEEGQVSAVVETPPVFHIPPPPTELPPPEEEEEDFNVDELRNLGVDDEAVEEVVAASHVNDVEAEVTQEEFAPPPEELSTAVETETSAVVSEFNQYSEEITQNSEEFAQNVEENVEEITQNTEENAVEFSSHTEEITQNVEETLENVENDISAAAEAEVEAVEDVQVAATEEIRENVTEVTENVSSQVEEQVEDKVAEVTEVATEVAPEPVVQVAEEVVTEVVPEPTPEPEPVVPTPEPVQEVSSSVNGQTTTVTETVTTYTPPEPEPVPTPAPVVQTPVSEPPKQANGSTPDIFGGLSAAEMKERLKSRKKVDPRSQPVGFSEKHKMFERL